MPPKSTITRIEIVIAAVVIIVAIAVFVPMCRHQQSVRQHAADLTQTLENMKRLQTVSAQMAQDGLQPQTNNARRWPEELAGIFTNWTTALVHYQYLTAEELTKLLSSPGRKAAGDPIPFANNNPVLVYTVGADSPGNTVFLSTDNFINTKQGGLLDNSATNHGTKDFAIVRKDGSGAILKPTDVGNTNTIGAFMPLCH